MASEQVGEIYYDVDANTGDLISSTKVIERETKRQANSIKRVETQTTKTSKAVTRGFAQVGRSAGQAGIQIQQFVGQLQTGTNLSVALSQQAADLGFVLGVPLLGAIVSVAAAFGGPLIDSLLGSDDAIQELIASIKEFEEISGVTINQGAAIVQANNAEIKEKRKLIEEIEKEIKANEELIKVNESLIENSRNLTSLRPGVTVASQVGAYRKAIEDASKELVNQRAELDSLNQSIVRIESDSEKYKEGVEATNEEFEKQVNLTTQLQQRLEVMQARVEGGEVAAIRLATAFQLGLTNAEMLPAEIDELITRLDQARQAQDKLKQSQIDAARARRQEETQQRQDQNLLQTLGVSQEVQARQQVVNQLRELERLRREGDLVNEQDYIDRRNEIVRQGNERLAAIQNQGTVNTLGAASNLFDGLAGIYSTFEGEQSGIYKALFAASKTFSIAQSIIAIQTGIAQASALPFPANLGAIATTIAATSSVLSTIQGTTLGGGRLYGGPVEAGKLYPVTEDGRPELLTQGSRQYLLPGSGGQVTSNRDMQSQSSQPMINVNIMTPPGYTADVQTSTSSGGATDINATITAVASDIRSGGQVYDAITASTTAGRKTI